LDVVCAAAEQPFVGWAASAAYPAPVIVFGLFDLPMIIGPNRALSDQLVIVHRSIALVIACLVTVHIAAALYHHIRAPGGVLHAMIPAERPTETPPT
jgi:cytochrome b561